MEELVKATIEKIGYSSGFEYTSKSDDAGVELASARHSAKALIQKSGSEYVVELTSDHTATLLKEIHRHQPEVKFQDSFYLDSEAGLSIFLKKASKLAKVLPNNIIQTYQENVEQELNKLPTDVKGTEIERLIKQRVGQQSYRQALLEYWGGKCAVTGVESAAVLRASHAKPWSECESDEERLDVFNGFLLTANLDALFDRFLITFDESGFMLVSKKIIQSDRDLLGLNQKLKLRWFANEHQIYLEYHRSHFE